VTNVDDQVDREGYNEMTLASCSLHTHTSAIVTNQYNFAPIKHREAGKLQ